MVERRVRIGWDQLMKFPELRVITPEGLNFGVRLPQLGKPYHEIHSSELKGWLRPEHVTLPSKPPSELERKEIIGLLAAHWNEIRKKLVQPKGHLWLEKP